MARNNNKNKFNKNKNTKGGNRNGNSKSSNNNNKPYCNTNYCDNRTTRKDKEVEVNIPDKSLNRADLNVLTKSGKANNDESWYNRLGQLYNDATSVPFNVLSGLPFSPIPDGNSTLNNDYANYTAPGIMTIKLAPLPGVSRDINSPVNIASQELYVAITKNNNRDGQYDRTDVMLLILAMDSAYMLYEFLNRGYRAFKNISAYNRYYPLNLLHAMKFDTETLQMSLEDFRSRLNLMAYRLSSINIPDVFSYISRHSWLFSHVYKDADTERAQAYMYMPDGFYIWKEGTGDSANYLEYVTFETLFGISSDNPEITLSMIDNAIMQVINPILGSSHVGLISADIAKAYAEAGMVKISVIDESASLEPQYDELVLMQMANSTLVEGLYRESLNVTQELSDLVSGPYLVCTPQTQGSSSPNIGPGTVKHYLNTRGEATNKFVAESTRLVTMLRGKVSEDPGSNTYIGTCGTEIVTGIQIWYLGYTSLNSAAQLVGQSMVQFLNLEENSTVGGNIVLLARQLRMMSAFDWAPTQYLFTSDRFIGVIQDLDNYMYLSYDQLKGMNDVIVMSEFKVE